MCDTIHYTLNGFSALNDASNYYLILEVYKEGQKLTVLYQKFKEFKAFTQKSKKKNTFI